MMYQTKECIVPCLVACNPYSYEIETSVLKIQGKPRVHGKAQFKKKAGKQNQKLF